MTEVPEALAPIASRLHVEDGCLVWTGAVTATGYGQLERKDEHGKRRGWLAHRYAWALAYPDEPLPPNLHHTCPRKLCVLPNHLVGMTVAEHTREHNTTEVCPKGHPRTDENTYRRPDGGRMCRPCQQERNRDVYRRNAERLIRARTERRRRAREEA